MTVDFNARKKGKKMAQKQAREVVRVRGKKQKKRTLRGVSF